MLQSRVIPNVERDPTAIEQISICQPADRDDKKYITVNLKTQTSS